MSYCLRILCQSDSPILLDDIKDFVEDGVFFDPDPTFLFESSQLGNPDWERLDIIYEQEKRPIIITNTSSGNLFTEELQELTNENASTARSKKVEMHLKSTRRIIGLDVDVVHMSEEAWSMLTHLEIYLASEFKGIVYAPDEGFYNANLKLIASVVRTES